MGEMIDFQAENGTATGYLAIPPGGNGPGIILMHAWWGLNDFFKQLADRLAAEGFVVIAPDLYGGKTASTIDDAKILIGELDSRYHEAIKHEVGALDYLLQHPAVQGNKTGAIGFSMGGSYANWLSALRPEVAAVVLFYGGSDWQPEGFTKETNASFLGHFAEGDEWEPDEGVNQFESELRAAGKEVAFHFYPGAGHWFFENNRPDAYNPDAARLAWERTLEFLRSKLN